jgi:hypothetical protein
LFRCDPCGHHLSPCPNRRDWRLASNETSFLYPN